MKIKSLSIQNFKAFGPEQRFDFDGKNVVIYGNNGSGKSSVYASLYTFMQSSIAGKQWQKYFDQSHAESLLNIYTSIEENRPFVRISTDTGQRYELGTEAVSTPARPTNHADIVLANLASDFMNYRLLFNFYNFRNSADANVWDVFEKEIFPNWAYDEVNNISFGKQLSDLRQRLYDLSQITELNPVTYRVNHIGTKQPAYKDLRIELEQFNIRFASTFRTLQPEIQTILNEHFLPGENINIQIEPIGSLSIKTKNKYELEYPILKLTLTVQGIQIERPQTFLNEARLTAVALSIRLAMVSQKFRSIPGRDDLRILVLDDLLISLDMSNRMKVIKYLHANEDFKTYQIIILTHDKGFFDIIKDTLTIGAGSDAWTWFEMFDNGDPASGRNPVCIEKNDLLDKARLYLESQEYRDYEICALCLRRKAEELLRLLYDPSLEELTRFNQQRTLFKALIGIKAELDGKTKLQMERVLNGTALTDHQIEMAFNGDIDISILPADQRVDAGKALALKKSLKKMLKWYNQNRVQLSQAKVQLSQICEDVNKIRGRILNSGAHFTHNPIFESELRTALERLEALKEATFNYIESSE